MPAIYPIGTGRVSDALQRQRLLSQFNYDQTELLRLQDQLSTGYRISVGSQDAPAAIRAIKLQGLIEQKEQIQINVATSQSFLRSTEDAISGISDMLAQVQAEALAAVGTPASNEEREIVVEIVQRTIEQLMTVANREFRGRHLFGGSKAADAPFEVDGDYIIYRGNEESLQSYMDVGFLTETNLTGQDVFGAVSPEVRGSVDLNPVLSPETRLADLRGGLGIAHGSFRISDGFSIKTIDTTGAETIGDVVRLIEENPPDGRTIVVRLSNTGLVVDIDDAGMGNLTIREVPGGKTAAELGILDPNGTGVKPIVGQDLNPVLKLTTSVDDILGTRATAALPSVGGENDILIEAAENGAALNGVQVRYISNLAAGDQALVTYDPIGKTLDIDISSGTTRANTVINALNATGLVTAQVDTKLDAFNDGSGTVELGATADLNGGSGIVFDRESGIQLVNKDQTYTFTFEDVETIEDVLNVLNNSEADVLATINADGNGIDVRSRVSGADFAIGENGGTTATELGIRTFTRDTLLGELNFDRGVDTANGTDFTIRRKDGVTIDVDISSAITVGDVIDLINNHPNNVGNPVVARLAEFGNGIELYDENTAGADTLAITRDRGHAISDLGFVPLGTDQATASAPTTASASLFFSPVNTDLLVTANQSGFAFNDVEIVFQDVLVGDVANATYDVANRQLLIDIDATQTTANTALAAINAEGTFTATLDTSLDPTNDGSGVIGATGLVATTSGGAPELLRAEDVNPLETKSVFNTLLRLGGAMEQFDKLVIERTLEMMDDDIKRVLFARADLGTRARSLDVIELSVQREDMELRKTLSEEIEVDMVAAISEMAARQANLEATLRLVGQTLTMTLLNFI